MPSCPSSSSFPSFCIYFPQRLIPPRALQDFSGPATGNGPDLEEIYQPDRISAGTFLAHLTLHAGFSNAQKTIVLCLSSSSREQALAALGWNRRIFGFRVRTNQMSHTT